MKWKKLGKIFDPTLQKLQDGCVQFAQSPQALVFDDFVRIYFSTRSVDQHNGKYLSHIAFVDLRKNLSDVVRISDKTVIPLGGLGCFDEHGIFPMNVLRHGGVVYGYTVAGAGAFQCRWRRPSVWLSAMMTALHSSASATGRCWRHHCTSPAWLGIAS
jgi:hypothetical protein